jgi:glycosyltransferase involved in cell wall biosynthesis
MKIGIDISQTVFEGTGVGVYFRKISETLPRVDGINKYVFFGSSLRRRQKNFWPFPPTLLDALWNQAHIFSVDNLIGKTDVFHTSDWLQPPTAAKKVTTIFDLVVFKFPETSHQKIVATQKRALEWAKKEVARFIAISQSTKKDAVKILKIPAEKIDVVYLAPSLGPIVPGIQKKYSLDKPYLLALGTKEPRKNLPRLIEAFNKLGRPDIDLIIVGKQGWETEVLPSNKNVRLLGYIPESDKPALYSDARAFVYPSLYEGFGIPILEAMSVGCPVITSNVGSMPEAGGKAAIYVDPNDSGNISDKLFDIITMPSKKYSELKSRSLDQAKDFSWEKAARETVEVYKKAYGS